jgi:hypothetical protein
MWSLDCLFKSIFICTRLENFFHTFIPLSYFLSSFYLWKYETSRTFDSSISVRLFENLDHVNILSLLQKKYHSFSYVSLSVLVT